MNYGLFLSAGGALTSLHRQDAAANNLANVNTPGFKPNLTTFRARLPERLESPGTLADPKLLLEQLGGGTHLNPTRIDLKQGSLRATQSPLDLAIDGKGFFLVATENTGDGAPSPDALRLTRDGRLTMDGSGRLVQAASGAAVLDVNGQPITLDTQFPVHIDEAGQISQSGAVVAQLRIVDVADPAALIKEGDNLIGVRGNLESLLQPATGRVRQGHIENSAVDPVLALNDLITATKSAEGNIKMMQYHDFIMGQAINTFGRVA